MENTAKTVVISDARKQLGAGRGAPVRVAARARQDHGGAGGGRAVRELPAAAAVEMAGTARWELCRRALRAAGGRPAAGGSVEVSCGGHALRGGVFGL